ncbi:WUSCHEL-related homeobox 12-like [Lolium rigidum]|uniref:WUSCHEL-related homeobox 12-like n=1 Tax=Lolium rigidum TaxID=89674 RepID=UPI001F5D42D5|nr:WUSCHEL-related homeobox 12-like [Lolium rigidum]
MASSNRHWPSMFRSNPAAACDFHHQPDMNNHHSRPSLTSSGIDQESGRTPGETKPRWNPRPEQIRILEGIFNSGVVNPPRDEIRRIRLRLQEYGHVADANVFYWFQNRKSRTKNKLRAAQAAAQGQQPTGRAALTRAPAPYAAPAPPLTPPRHLLAPAGTLLQGPTSSSSSSSDRSSGSSRSVTMKPAASQAMLPPSAATTMGLFTPAPPASSPALSACQLYCLQSHPMPMLAPATSVRELINTTPESPPPLLLQWPPQSQYLPATELGGVLGSHAHTPVSTNAHLSSLCNEAALGQQEIIDVTCCSKLGLGSGQFFSTTTATGTTDMPSHRTDAVSAVFTEDEKARLGTLHYGLGAVTTAAAPAAFDVSTATALPCAAPANNAAAASSAFTDQLQGLVDAGLLMGGGAPAAPAMVVAVAAARPDVGAQWFSVPAMTRLDVGLFGEAAVLLRHTGEPVPLDGSGVTVEPLHHGAVYYVLV